MEAKPTMVIGCGERGAAWAAKKSTPEQPVISFDNKKFDTMREPYVIGDAFKLPFESNSKGKIYADFAINGFDRKIPASEILKNPDVLDSDNFSPLVRDWYVNKLERSHEQARNNIGKISRLLKTDFVRELWRVTALNGKLVIIDFDYNIDWLKENAYSVIQDRPLLLRPARGKITPEDFERSESLERVIKTNKVQKIIYTKLPVQTEATASLVGS